MWLAIKITVAALVIALVLAFGACHQRAEAASSQPSPCAGLRVYVLDQVGNPVYWSDFSMLQSDGEVIGGWVQDGYASFCLPAGETKINLMGEEKILVVKENIVTEVFFTRVIELPSSEWLKLYYRGQNAHGDQIFGLTADRMLLHPGRWEVSILHNGDKLGDSGVLATQKENAMVIVLPQGEQTLELKARHYDSGDEFSFGKIVQVEAPLTPKYTMGAKGDIFFWFEATQPQQFSNLTCKFWLQGSEFEEPCPVNEEEAISLPQGDLQIQAWNEEIFSIFEVEVSFFQLHLPTLFSN